MSLFTPEARAQAIARAARGIDRLDHRPIRGLNQPLRTQKEAMQDIRAYEQAHGLAPRNIAPLVRSWNLSRYGFDTKFHVVQ